jgi:hypothetical protein
MSHFTPKGILATTLLLVGSLLGYAQAPPLNHVTSFAAATQSSTTIRLTWVASAGSPAPTGYLILVRVVPAGTIVAPVDDDPSILTDDSDFSDNLGSRHVTSGTATTVDVTVDAEKDYEFKIYPYVGTGADAPYFKTNGTVPPATASTKKPSVILRATDPVTAIDETVGTVHAEVTSNNGTVLTERGVKWGYSSGALTNTSADPATTVGTFTRGLTA